MEGDDSLNKDNQDYVVISDDDENKTDATSEKYHVPKKRRADTEPGPSGDYDTGYVRSNVQNMKSGGIASRSRHSASPVTADNSATQSLDNDDSDITITEEIPTNHTNDDDEPVITNVIDNSTSPSSTHRPTPLTWQLSSSGSNIRDILVRRNGHSVSRYRSDRRRPTARRPIRTREYGDFLHIVRDITNDGVIINPMSPERPSNWGTRRSGTYSRHVEPNISPEFGYYPNSTNQPSGEILNHRAQYSDGGMVLGDVQPIVRGVTTSISRHNHQLTPRGAAVAAAAHQEMFHMNNLRDRITILRRELQNLNGLLTDSFQLLHRLVPQRVPLPRIEKEVLDRVPTKLASSSDVSNAEKTCSICLGHYKEGETLRVLPCTHEFHEYCIDRWLISFSRNCPFCRTDVHEALNLNAGLL